VIRRFVLVLRSNWLSWSGTILTTLSCMAFVTSVVYFQIHGRIHGPYAEIVAWIVLPALFVLGLLLIPIGLLVYRRQVKERVQLLAQRSLHLARLLGLLTAVNFAVVGTAGYESARFMDSQQFCGMVCHKVMSPTYLTYVDSPHAHVECVECHIGSGAANFVEAKLNGMRQLWELATDSYHRPIPTPVHNLHAASETCEHCHWNGRFVGDRLVVRRHFGNDAASTPSTNVLTMKVGGPQPDGKAVGAHWHASEGTQVDYVATDDSRKEIVWVRSTDRGGKEHVFTAGDTPADPPAGTLRHMDCVDCHNQPSHRQQEAAEALDGALASGAISRQLPSIRKVGLELLKKEWKRETASADLAAELGKLFPESTTPAEQRPLVAPAAAALATIWLRNVHPEMGMTWGTYESRLGHKGCFRCHDGLHADAQGNAISNDCTLCHTVVAEKESSPEILKTLGVEHP
jgi:hypothetical protein